MNTDDLIDLAHLTEALTQHVDRVRELLTARQVDEAMHVAALKRGSRRWAR